MTTLEFDPLKLKASNMFAYGGRAIYFDDGTKELVRDPLEWVRTSNDYEHIVKRGDILSNIAFVVYKISDPENAVTYWWIIADVNAIVNPLDISSFEGKALLIPNLEDVKLKIRR